MQNTFDHSESLQQSLLESIRESRNRSRHQSSSITESLCSDSMKMSETNRTIKYQETKKPLNQIIDYKDYEKMWPQLCSQLKNQNSHYLFEIQANLDLMSRYVQDKVMHKVIGLIHNILEVSQKIIFILDEENMYLHNSFIKQLQKFLEDLDIVKITFGIVGETANINEIDHFKLQQQQQLIQDIYSRLAMVYFLNNNEIEDINDQLEKEINDDDNSIGSDFSDENFEVEGFESETIVNFIRQIKNQLTDPDIYDNCKSYHFVIQENNLSLKDFFIESLDLNNITDYEIVCFLYYSGLFQKLIKHKKNKNKDILNYFIQNLQNVINRIMNFGEDSLIDWIKQNTYEIQYLKLSCRAYNSKRNIIKKQIHDVMECKIKKWIQINLNDFQMTEFFYKDLENATDKQSIRKLAIKWNIPLNRIETQILSYEKNTLFNQNQLYNLPEQTIQSQSKNQISDLILQIYPNGQDLLFYFQEQDKLQNGLLDFKQFYMAIKTASLPVTLKEVSKIFQNHQEVIGKITLNGINSRKVIDYNKLIYQIYGIQFTEQDEEQKSVIDNKMLTKYTEKNTQQILIRSLQHQNKKLNLQNNEIISKLSQLEIQLKTTQDTLSSKDRMIEQLQQPRQTDLVKQNEKLQNQREKNIENLSILGNQNTVNNSKIVQQEKQWIQEQNQFMRQLLIKDQQIEQYRIQLEGLVNELNFIKTSRPYSE